MLKKIPSRICLIASLFLLSGCIVIPYPHDVYPHSNVTGRIEDSDSGNPLEGVAIRLADDVVRTDSNGMFKFEARKRRSHVIVLFLAPIDVFDPCHDELVINPYSTTQDKHYRSLAIGVKSCPVSNLVGYNYHLKNPEIHDDIGAVKLVSNSSQPGGK